MGTTWRINPHEDLVGLAKMRITRAFTTEELRRHAELLGGRNNDLGADGK